MIDKPADLEATKARQGARGTNVFWILAFSTALALIVVAVVWFVQAPRLAQTNPGTARNQAVAGQFHTPALPPAAPALQPGTRNGT